MNKSKPQRAPGRPKHSEHSTPLQEHILRQAAFLFMENGYEPISLQYIAKVCEVTKASIYYYFTSKAELFTAAVVYILQLARQSTLRHLEEEVDLRVRLERIAQAKMMQSHVDMETMLREAKSHLSEDQYQRIRQAEQDIHAALAAHMQLAIDQGTIRSGNAMLLAHAFSALVMLGNRENAVEQVGPHEELAKAVVDLFWNGIAAQTK